MDKNLALVVGCSSPLARNRHEPETKFKRLQIVRDRSYVYIYAYH